MSTTPNFIPIYEGPSRGWRVRCALTGLYSPTVYRDEDDALNHALWFEVLKARVDDWTMERTEEL